ncbi:MAG: hypothetical protein IPL43_12880 [Micropruina sp.]|nr:hypothetical protein [Micropruina sp.]
MGTYGETGWRATLPTTTFNAIPSTDDQPTGKCDQCVAPSVAVVVVGEGASALALEFCAHHLAQHTDKLADRGHQVRFHK